MSATLRKTQFDKAIAVVNHLPVFPFFGAEGEGNEGDGSSGGTGGAGEGDSEGEGNRTPPEGETEAEAKLRKANYESMTRRQENDRLKSENAALKAERDKQERKDKSDLENAQRDLTERDEKLSKRDQILKRNLVQTAILMDDNYTWHDLDLVITALDSEIVTVDLDEGRVEGIAEELKRIAKDKAFLVKSSKKEKKQEDQNGKPQGQQQQRGASGTNPGGAGQQQVNQALANRQELIKKSPALRALGRS